MNPGTIAITNANWQPPVSAGVGGTVGVTPPPDRTQRVAGGACAAR